MVIREARLEDSQTILDFIRELAIYEKAEDKVEASVELIQEALFGKEANCHGLIAEVEGEAIGFAVYFHNFSTWVGKKGLYLEDLYVSPDYRGVGAGKALIKRLAQIAVEKDCGRFEWVVLDWNKSAIDFYESIGAKAQDEWIIYRLSGNELKSFANS